MRPTESAIASAPSGDASPTLEEVLSEHLDDEDLESLVYVYLQNRYGYLVRTASPQLGPARAAYLLRNAAHNEALVRARHGHSLVSRDARSLPTGAVDRVFVFSPTESYGPDPAPNVVEIEREDLIDFIREERWSLPLSVENWVRHALDD